MHSFDVFDGPDVFSVSNLKINNREENEKRKKKTSITDFGVWLSCLPARFNRSINTSWIAITFILFFNKYLNQIKL